MLPQGTLDDLLYPMTAEIYYPSISQNDFGESVKSWSLDRAVSCSAIKENPQSSMRTALISEKFIEYDVKINMRTNEDISVSSLGLHYMPTDILITNIKDPLGQVVWKESLTVSTSFEVDIVEPMYDYIHNLNGYRILLRRSDLQVGS